MKILSVLFVENLQITSSIVTRTDAGCLKAFLLTFLSCTEGNFHFFFYFLILFADKNELTFQNEIMLAHECQKDTAAVEECKEVSDKININSITEHGLHTTQEQDIEELEDKVE